MKRKISLILIPLLLVGCTQAEKIDDRAVLLPQDEPEIAAVANIGQTVPDSRRYRLYNKKDDYMLSAYEPAEGCYLGAYILSNKKINFDMEEFDKLTGKEHSLFMYNMKLGDPFPANWILSCIAQMKTPYIVVMPPNDYQPFDENLLEQTAREFGEFYIPIFVDFYPLSGRSRFDAEAYKAFYQKARSVFAKHASNTAFVWSVTGEEVFNAAAYYPGDQAVDWAGLSLYRAVQSGEDEDGTYGTDAFNEIDYFYYSFQKTKPLIISQLAISHYTGDDHVYRTKEAAEEITRIYDRLIHDYPRVKAIIYMDFNGIELSPGKAGGDNFSVTDDNTVREAYSRAIEHEKFLSMLDMASSGDVSPQLMKSPFSALKWEEVFYISEKTLSYDLGMRELDAYQSKMIGGQTYFKLSDMSRFKDSTIEEHEKKIILRESDR